MACFSMIVYFEFNSGPIKDSQYFQPKATLKVPEQSKIDRMYVCTVYRHPFLCSKHYAERVVGGLK